MRTAYTCVHAAVRRRRVSSSKSSSSSRGPGRRCRTRTKSSADRLIEPAGRLALHVHASEQRREAVPRARNHARASRNLFSFFLPRIPPPSPLLADAIRHNPRDDTRQPLLFVSWPVLLPPLPLRTRVHAPRTVPKPKKKPPARLPSRRRRRRGDAGGGGEEEDGEEEKRRERKRTPRTPTLHPTRLPPCLPRQHPPSALVSVCLYALLAFPPASFPLFFPLLITPYITVRPRTRAHRTLDR
ncbi:hypothetical protein GGS23DRAFT_462215 [Durotheca rogersii]|uniref:uncharacterized protein n=1 Tax=Durotheca rogersii TaxID=419775 RepID=UPI00221E907F|nr:uncharacterized protein GGS23DRAFT_462215 [Durotheca rogersii]KAI5864759.1 hypothetical protein GGS23DRAFT_462215 [Durotheca rogersii]